MGFRKNLVESLTFGVYEGFMKIFLVNLGLGFIIWGTCPGSSFRSFLGSGPVLIVTYSRSQKVGT